MGWKGTIRTIRSTANKIERESKKRERELDKQRKEYQKLQEKEQAILEVEEYDNYIDRLKSIHKETPLEINWNTIFNEEKPTEPIFDKTSIEIAKNRLNDFKPNFFQKVFKTAEKNKKKLKKNLEEVKLNVEKEHKKNMLDYENNLFEYTEKKEIAEKVLAKDMSIYLKVIEEFNPFEEISDLGSNLKFTIKNERLFIDLQVYSNSIIPSEVKTILKSGKLSVKNMTKGIYNELYQDYVCSAVLRVSRELFSLLPLNEIVINAKDEVLNTSTGYKELNTILSVLIVRDTFNQLNLEYIDPSDSMSNFVHNMNFKKTLGFKIVEEVN